MTSETSYKLSCTEHTNYLHIHIEGTCRTYETAIDLIHAVVEEAAGRRFRNLLITRSGEITLGMADAFSLARECSNIAKDLRHVAYVPPGGANLGVVRYFVNLLITRGSRLRLFENTDDADEWLRSFAVTERERNLAGRVEPSDAPNKSLEKQPRA
ncbi:MAG: hypothetical protein QUS14_14120 [Pyrinomonadaceae bacterium]|nr:hypothetical protein [Pyrinomonadaceae bacterium]